MTYISNSTATFGLISRCEKKTTKCCDFIGSVNAIWL